MKNGDRIRQMSNEELTEVLLCPYDVAGAQINIMPCVKNGIQEMVGPKQCKKCIEDWLEKQCANENETDIVVFDVETTGLNPEQDEVLQLSIIDGDGNVLFNSYIKPYFHKKWDDAQQIHGISPEDVKNAPYPHEVVNEVEKIFALANIHIAYNGVFDMRFLRRWMIRFSPKEYHDVMREFAPIFGEWNEEINDYKWQKLTKCAEYFGYEYMAHDALEDVKATLFCWKKMNEDKKTDR